MGAMAPASLSSGFQSFTPLPTIKLGHMCWFPSKWACAHSRPLWVSPTTSPVRLGVSPAAAPTPTGVFTERFEALFPCAGALVCVVCFAPPPFPLVYLCTNVELQGLLAAAL